MVLATCHARGATREGLAINIEGSLLTHQKSCARTSY